jgi:hypothetical protein
MKISRLLRESLHLAFHPALLGLSVLYAAAATAGTAQADFLDMGNPYWLLTMATILFLMPLYDAVFISIAGRLAARRNPLQLSGDRVLWKLGDSVASSFVPLFVGQLMVTAAIFIGSLLILPGIYFGIRAALYRQAIVLRHVSPTTAIRESFARIRTPRLFLTVGLFLAVWIGVELGLEEMLFVLGAGPVATILILVPVAGFLLCTLNAMLTVLYLELTASAAAAMDRSAGSP